MRCLAIAEEMRRRTHDVVFMTGPLTPEAVPLLRRSGFPLVEVAPDERLAATLFDLSADLLVVDHYGIDAETERLARAVVPVATIEDQPGRRHACDLLADPTSGRLPAEYKNFVPDGATIVCGAHVALLRQAFPEARSKALDRRDCENVERVLICFGATDPGAVTLPVAQAIVRTLRRSSLEPVAIDIVVGAVAASRESLKRFANASDNVTLHLDPPDMAQLLLKADVAVGASGSMTWERCCLALPSVVAALVENQRDIAVMLNLAAAAAVIEVGSGMPQRFAEAVALLIESRQRRIEMASCAAAICDGQGARRLATAMEQLVQKRGCRPVPQAALLVRTAGQGDMETIWAWRNDIQTRRVSQDSAPIAWGRHKAWFNSALHDPARLLLIGELADEPVGHVRFDRNGESNAVISINLAPSARGQGLGSPLLRGACAQARQTWNGITVVADVSGENLASMRMFTACGFGLSERNGGFVRLTLPAGKPTSA